MLTAVSLCLAGLAALVLGADFVTRSGSALAAQLGVPPIVVGLTIVAVGTSTPELAVALESAAQGDGALAVGNVAGANIINLLLLLGVTAMLRPVPLALRALKLESPATVAVAFALVAMTADGRLSPAEGAALLAAAVAYTGVVTWLALGESRSAHRRFAREYPSPSPRPRAMRDAAWRLAVLGAGITVTLVGAGWFVEGAIDLARRWSVSEAFIGVTVVALGTTSPELATTIVSIVRNQGAIGLGNLFGSTFYNITLVLGAAGLVSGSGIPLSAELIQLDLPVMAMAALATMWLFASGRRVSRLEGGGLVAAYLMFLGYLIVTRT